MAGRNDLSVYGSASWWEAQPPWLTSLANIIPPRLEYARRSGLGIAGRRVLDLGCGGGLMAEALCKAGAQVTGVDPSSGALEQARAHAGQMSLDIQYVEGGAYEIPLEDGAVDLVVCVDVLEHLTEVQTAFHEIARVLKPGGALLFDTLNRTLFARLVNVTLAEDLLGLLPRGIHDPKLFIRPEELRAFAERAGMKVGGICGLGPTGIGRRGVLTFGLLPVTWGMYIGHAYKSSSG